MSYQCFKNTIVTCVILLCLLLGISIWAFIPHKDDTGDSTETLYRISDTELIYDNNIRVVYYYLYNGYMSPYYNAHGQLCRYVDGEITPIE